MKDRKLIIYTMFADLLGVLLFIFSIQVKNNVVLYTFYILTLLLLISAILALYNNINNKNKYIFLFIIFISIVLILLCTLYLFN